MTRSIRWMTRLAVLGLSAQALVFAGPEAKTKPASSAGKRAIPVAPEARLKMHAVFAKHAQTPLARHQEVRTQIMQALVVDDLLGAQRLQLELQERGAELDAAKRAMTAELDKAGYSKAVQEQEWKGWLAKHDAAREAKATSP
jgi:hypothetical protein